LDLREGRLSSAHELSGHAVELAERGGWGEGPAAACAYLASATVAYRRGELERAEGLLSHAGDAAEIAPAPVRFAVGVLCALVLAAAGPRSAAGGALKLRAIRAAIADSQIPAVPEFLAVAIEDAEVRVLSAAGEHDQAHAALARALALRPRCPELLVREV